MRSALFLLVALLLSTATAWAQSQPVNFRRASSAMRTATTIANVVAPADVTSTPGANGVLGEIVPGAATAAGSTTSFTPAPYPARLNVQLVDGGATAVLTCTSCSLTGYNALGVMVSETVSTIAESESLTANSYESLTAFSCAGCANLSAEDSIVAVVSDHPAVDVPIASNAVGGSSDVIAVCKTELDVATTDWDCVSGSRCTVDGPSQSVDLASCLVEGGAAAAFTVASHDTFVIRARANRAPVPLYER